MKGYWKNGWTPFTTTGDNFLENFKFFTPIAGGLLWFLAIGIPLVMINNVINPTHRYRFENHDYHLTVNYQVDSDNNVTGNVYHVWKDSNNNTHYLDSEFIGKINNNVMTVTLEKENKIVQIYLNNNEVSFMGRTAPKI